MHGLRDGGEERWGEQITKRYKETSGRDRYMYHLDCGTDSDVFVMSEIPNVGSSVVAW